MTFRFQSYEVTPSVQWPECDSHPHVDEKGSQTGQSSGTSEQDNANLKSRNANGAKDA